MSEIEYRGYTIRIEQDDNPENPRDWDNLGIMLCFHRRYDLGDNTELRSNEFGSWDAVEEYLVKKLHAKFIKPLYLYDHSGITIATHPFSCPWDSGQVGFIYTTSKLIRTNFGHKPIAKIEKDIIANLESEVSIYDSYIRGDVCGYIIEKNGEHHDSCWGFYSDDEAIKAAKHIIDNWSGNNE